MKRKIVSLLLALVISASSFSQITVKLGSIENAEPGTKINIPLSVTGLSASGQSFIGIELLFEFQNNILTFDSLANGHPTTPLNQWFAGSVPGKVSANWLEPSLIPVNVDDNSVLVEFVFLYNGGFTDLTLINSSTFIYDAAGNNLPIGEFINGSVSQSQGSENSVWNGTGEWNAAGNWSFGIPGDSTDAIISSGTVSLLSGGVCRNLTINNGAEVLVKPGQSLSVNGDFINDGEILIESDSLVQGSFIVIGTITQSGTSNMEKNVYNDINYFLASPSQDVNASIFNGIGEISRFDENSGNWSALTSSDILNPFSGYLFHSSAESVINYSGLYNKETLNINLQYTPKGDPLSEGWNLVGNSFTSSFDADNFISSVNTDRAIYTWDGYKYRVWNGVAGSVPNGIIPPATAFFIRAYDENAGVIFNNQGRKHDFSYFNSSYSSPENVLNVKLNNFDNAALEDMAFVQIDPGATFNFDNAYDAFKLANSSEYPEIYLHSQDDQTLAISSIPEATEVLAGVRLPVDGTYVISAETSSFLPEKPVYLIDQVAQINKNLRNEDYVFIANAGDYPERFILVFTGLNIEEPQPEIYMHAFFNGNSISLITEANLERATVTISDVSGRIQYLSKITLLAGQVYNFPAFEGINILNVIADKKAAQFKIPVLF